MCETARVQLIMSERDELYSGVAGLQSDFPADQFYIPVKPEPVTMVTQCGVIIHPITDGIVKQELEPAENISRYIECDEANLTFSSRPGIQMSQQWIGGQEVSPNRPTSTRSEVKSKTVDETHTSDNSWQIYKDGKPFGHIADATQQSNLNRSMNQDSQSNSMVVQPVVSAPNMVTSDGTALTGDEQFECPLCAKCFAQRRYLRNHMETHTAGEVIKCPECPSTFKWKNNWKRYMLTHGEREFKCSKCPSSFTQARDLTIHMKIHTGKKPFKCAVCEYSSVRSSSLKRHMKMHSAERAFKCWECPSTFKELSNLKIHLRMHTGEKPFKCSVCEYRCTNSSSLIRHKRTHLADRVVRCSECPSTFKWMDGLRKHMLTHRGVGAFRCQVCPSSFRQATKLTMHMKLHTGEKPFKCSE